MDAVRVETAFAAIERRPVLARTIPVMALGWSLSLFLVVSFLLCVAGYWLLPSLQIPHAVLILWGFEFNSWPRFFLGLFESFAWGWYVALILGPLYNFFVTRAG